MASTSVAERTEVEAVPPLVKAELSSSAPIYKANFMASIANPTVVVDLDPSHLEQGPSTLGTTVTSLPSKTEEGRLVVAVSPRDISEEARASLTSRPACR